MATTTTTTTTTLTSSPVFEQPPICPVSLVAARDSIPAGPTAFNSMIPASGNGSRGLRAARSTSIDIVMTEGNTALGRTPFRQQQQHIKDSFAPSLPHQHHHHHTKSPVRDPSVKSADHLTWRERDPSKSSMQRWRPRRILTTLLLLVTCALLLHAIGFFSSSGTLLFGSRGASIFGSVCNPYAVPGKLHVDYSEPSNNYWTPNDNSGTCRAPRIMRSLRAGNWDSYDWLQNRTVVLIGDSIERDHVTLFCNLLGHEAEIVKGKHRFAIPPDSASAALEGNQKKKRDRYRRIAYKGMQDSTLPRVCHIPEINFMMASLYHFGLDTEDYWKTLDSFHFHGALEERFPAQIEPFLDLMRNDGRGEPDLVEISSGMFDLARWAQQDIAAQKSTEDSLSDDRLGWYRSRVARFMDLTSTTFPHAMKMWRASSMPEEQAAELDYFNDRFGHSPPSVAPYFPLSRVHQIDSVARRLSSPYSISKSIMNNSTKRSGAGKFVYNPWASVIRGLPAHQLDRLHGGDLASPATIVWSDILLWHLKQSVTNQ